MNKFSAVKDRSELAQIVKDYIYGHTDDGIFSIKKAVIEIILNSAAITINDNEFFFGNIDCGGVSAAVRDIMFEKFGVPMAEEKIPSAVLMGEQLRAYTGTYDFGHTAPDWKNILGLGFVGLKERAVKALESGNAKSERNEAFYKLVISHYDNAFLMLERMAQLAERGTSDPQMAESLKILTKRPPQTLYEAMQTMIVYYTLQTIVDDNNARTFGRLDDLLFPYYKADIESGRLTEDDAAMLTRRFLERLASYQAVANIPFAICGDSYGSDMSNEYTYVLLRQFISVGSPDLKLHFLYSKATPNDLVDMAIDAIISGSNSIVFLNDSLIKSALVKVGIEGPDAEYYLPVGCYEPCGHGEICCSCNGMVNLGKAIELTFTGGCDMSTGELIGAETPTDFSDFDAFYSAFKQQLIFFAEAAKTLTRAREESNPLTNTGGYLSSTFDYCMEHGTDAYADHGAKYENSSINANGLATATDSLLVIKKLVFEEKKLTFAELRNILLNDWEGNERYRLWAKNRISGYGTNNDEADNFAKDILELLSENINNSPNSKGGVFRLGAFSVDNRFYLGEKTAATPDGRVSGETLSKNMSANLWGDKDGVTAHILSCTKLDGHLFPNGSVLDLVVHRSAVTGKSGRDNFKNTLKVFMARGGFSVHYNVLDPSSLKEAQRCPEKYPNLQIRLCGWNVLFNTLSKKEQDEFIYSAERR